MTKKFERWNSYFARLLGFEYFDGPMAGIGLRPDKSAQYFKILAWDDNHYERIFAIVPISPEVAASVWTAFEAVEPPRSAEWYPQSMGHGNVQAGVEASIAAVRAQADRSIVEKVVQSQDLIGRTDEVTPDDRQALVIRQMMSEDKLVELGTVATLEEFLRVIET